MNAYRLFQSTLPRGERLLHSGQPATNSGFQSTLPRGERHRCTHCVHARHCISIHAPARGATIRNHANCFLFCISIHAPARGATLLRRDHSALRNISIHAPARGATKQTRRRMPMDSYFNPRSREGSDRMILRPLPELTKFQSTLPRGERLCSFVVHAL